VVTIGGTLLASCRQLRADGALIDTVVCAIARPGGLLLGDLRRSRTGDDLIADNDRFAA
jgi:hypothetical protein